MRINTTSLNYSQTNRRRTVLYCARRGTVIHLNGPSKLTCFPSLERAPTLVYMCGRRTRPFSGRAFREHIDQRGCPSNPFHLSSFTLFLHPERKASPQEGGQVAPPLRVSNEHCFPFASYPHRRGWNGCAGRFAPSDVLSCSPPSHSCADGSETSGWLDCPSLRASSDHSFIVGALRARRMVQSPATFFCARPSTPSPPSLCAAHRPWLVRAPSRRQGAAAETLRQRPSCAPHLF